MERVLISACLLGKRVRYDGKALTVSSTVLNSWVSDSRHVGICPEVLAGLSIPRPAAEIVGGDGGNVLAGEAKVVDNTERDMTRDFTQGAERALSLCMRYDIKVAVLAEYSPSCGSSMIYDGTFTRKKISGVGVTTALLRDNGIQVFNQYEFNAADEALNRPSRNRH